MRGKRAVSRLSRGAAEGWALTVGVAGLIPALVNEGRTLPPAANLVVSNVPGPRDRRYYAGAEMVGYYPVSILTHGQGLNVTVLSRATSVDFGVTGSRALVKDLGRFGDALELELDAHVEAVLADIDRRRNAMAPIGAQSEQKASAGASEAKSARVA